MDLRIAGRWAVLCAASEGLGFACAAALVAEGVNVVINARRPEQLKMAAQQLQNINAAVSIKWVSGDITQSDIQDVVLNTPPVVDILKAKYIERYIAQRKTDHISHRTLQNEMSALRAILAQAGKLKLAAPDNPRLNNRALGIADMSRKGTKAALTPTAFREIFQQVEQKDRGVAAVMQLAYVLGLRTKEAVEAYKSLATWKKALENGHTSVRVVFGTKGGRPRQTVILDRKALQHAIAYAEREQAGRSGRLIDKPTIHQAIDRYRYVVRSAGLVGKQAPHSMRYHFAEQSGAHYKAQGFSEREALALVSMDLGHSDGRGRYIRQVYYQNIEGE